MLRSDYFRVGLLFLCVLVMPFLVSGVHALAGDPAPFTVQARFAFTDELLSDRDVLELISLTGSDDGATTPLGLEWRKERSAFGFVTWSLFLRDPEGELIRLERINPQSGRVYDLRLAFNPATGALSLALAEAESGAVLYARETTVAPVAESVHPVAGAGALQTAVYEAFLPVAVTWRLLEEAADGSALPTVKLSKQRAAWLEVTLPEVPMPGGYRLVGMKDGEKVEWVPAFSGSGTVRMPVALDDVPAGQWQVGIEYGEGDRLWPIGTLRPAAVSAGVVRVAVVSLERRGDAAEGALVLQSDGLIRNLRLRLYADIAQWAGGQWMEAEQRRLILDTAVDVPEEPVTVPFRFGIAEFRDRALELVFHVETGDEQGVEVMAGREEHFLPQWDTGTMGGIPQVDISRDTWRQVVIDDIPGTYLGHPDTVLMSDGQTIFVVYPLGHGGATVLRRSDDGGQTWTERLPVHPSWAQTANVPTIFRLVDRDGTERLIVYQNMARPNEENLPGRGENYISHSISLDGGRTWSAFERTGLAGPVAPNTMLEVEPGVYMTVFQLNGTIQLSVTRDGGQTWEPQRTIATHRDARLTEPAIVPSPDGKELAVLIRENSRRYNSMLIVSKDGGKTWSEPVELPVTLTGDRHMPRYAPDGRLVITFRDMAEGSPTKGDFVAWVGTWDDLVNLRPGQFRVRLLENKRNEWDTGYAGLELLPDGTFVSTTYVPLRWGDPPSVVSVRFTIDELDTLVAKEASH